MEKTANEADGVDERGDGNEVNAVGRGDGNSVTAPSASAHTNRKHKVRRRGCGKGKENAECRLTVTEDRRRDATPVDTILLLHYTSFHIDQQ
ncbi:hypothetical protein V9T40_005895 [Parthenolecanium corni]|uniref:Uncharacterized protein n=1 Tax=Parthenolecanium corni TaxID=536013 RepID=A0AAN9U2J5_9HEMI